MTSARQRLLLATYSPFQLKVESACLETLRTDFQHQWTWLAWKMSVLGLEPKCGVYLILIRPHGQRYKSITWVCGSALTTGCLWHGNKAPYSAIIPCGDFRIDNQVVWRSHYDSPHRRNWAKRHWEGSRPSSHYQAGSRLGGQPHLPFGSQGIDFIIIPKSGPLHEICNTLEKR